jgi:hypothetical protein
MSRVKSLRMILSSEMSSGHRFSAGTRRCPLIADKNGQASLAIQELGTLQQAKASRLSD